MTQNLNSSSNCMKTVKFLYSYGGKIVPRPTDGELRYVHGHTRVLSADRSVTFSELMVKFGESCGCSMNLKCKLPNEDLDVLVSIKSEEDLKNVIEEYERASPDAKIRAVLYPINSAKKHSSPSSPVSCFDFPSPLKYLSARAPSAPLYYAAPPYAATYRCCSPAVGYPIAAAKYSRCERRARQFYHESYRNHSH